MKASYITAYGGKEVIGYGDLQDPEVKDNEVIVRVKAVSINPLDYKIRSGALKFIAPSKFPRILGSDFSGVVENTGNGVISFKPGDKVYGATPVMFGKPGALAALVAVDPAGLRIMPDGINFEEAASLPVGALTALSGLRKGNAGPGKKVLVNGAAGGVGHFAVQIAKAKGSLVTASCSSKNADFVRSLGADSVTGYSDAELQALDQKFDIILDAYGKMKVATARRLLVKNGVYASTLFLAHKAIRKFIEKVFFGKTFTSSSMRGLPGDYDDLEKMVKEKKVKPFIDRVFDLKDTAEAFDYAENSHPRGKVIVSVKS